MNAPQPTPSTRPEDISTEVTVRHPKNTRVEVHVVNTDNGAPAAADLSAPAATAAAGVVERQEKSVITDKDISKSFSKTIGRIDGVVERFATSSFSHLEETAAVVTSLKEVRQKLIQFAEGSKGASAEDVAGMLLWLRKGASQFEEARDSFSKNTAEGDQKKELSLLKGSLTNEHKKLTTLIENLGSYCDGNNAINIEIKLKPSSKKAAASAPKDTGTDGKGVAQEPASPPSASGAENGAAAQTSTGKAPEEPPVSKKPVDTASTERAPAPGPVTPPTPDAGEASRASSGPDTAPKPASTPANEETSKGTTAATSPEKSSAPAPVPPPVPGAGEPSGASAGSAAAPKPASGPANEKAAEGASPSAPNPATGPSAGATVEKSRLAPDLLKAFREFPESIPELANAKKELLRKIEKAKEHIAEAKAVVEKLVSPEKDGKILSALRGILPSAMTNWFRERRARDYDKPIAQKHAAIKKMQEELRSIEREYTVKARQKFEGAQFTLPKENPDKIPGVIIRASIPAAKADTLFSFADLAKKLEAGAPAGTVTIDADRGLISVIKDGKAVHFKHRRDGKVSVFADFGDGKGASHVGSAWNDDALKGALKFADNGHLKFVKKPWDEERIIPPADMFKKNRSSVAPAAERAGQTEVINPASVA